MLGIKLHQLRKKKAAGRLLHALDLARHRSQATALRALVIGVTNDIHLKKVRLLFLSASTSMLAIPFNVSISSLLGGGMRRLCSDSKCCCCRCRSSQHWRNICMRTPSFPALPRPSRASVADRMI